MTTYAISDVLHGIIRFRRDGITTGEFLLKKTITVANGDLINIIEEYTSDSGTASKTVFRGRITYVDYEKTQYVHAIDVADELNQIRPEGVYRGYTEVVFGEIINDAGLTNVLCTQSSSSVLLKPTADVSVGSWTTAPLYSKIDDEDAAPEVTDAASILSTTPESVCEFSMEDNGLSATYNYIIYKVEVTVRLYRYPSNDLSMDFYDGTSWQGWQRATTATGSYQNKTYTFDDLLYTQDDVDSYKIRLKSVNSIDDLRVSNVYIKCYYRYYPNLAKCTVKADYLLGGNKTITEVLKTLNLIELKTWYADPDLEIHFTAGDVVSGESLIVADKATNIVGKRQIITYDKVILYGSYSGGAQIVSTSGAGANGVIWQDSYLSIIDQTQLDALAAQILTEQSANTLKIQIMRRDATDGIYQVGETFAIAADVEIKFSGSDRYIPNNTTYIINKIDYVISNGIYNYLDIEIIDGLIFSTPKDDSLGIVQDNSVENSLGIYQVAGGESVGQANTGSNLGTDGYGVFDSKSGVTLGFRNIAPASSKVTITLNTYDIDVDIDESEINHDALNNFVQNEHLLVGAIDHDALLNFVANKHLLVGAIDHDSLLNYLVDKHIAHAGVSIIAGTGLSGGGTIAASRTVNCDITQYTNNMADARIVVQNTHPAGTIDQAIDALIASHVIAGHTLNQINNPSDDKEFNFANKHLHFTWVAPYPGAHHGAFELEASGAFQNDLVHIHQHTGNPGVTNLVYIEAEDPDVTSLHVKHGADILDLGAGGLKLGTGARITIFDTTPLVNSDTKVPTNTTVKEAIDVLKEQSAAFPGAPSEGDLHYDEDDDSLYRYNAEAGKWVEVGVGGNGITDNLGNHIAIKDLNMDTNKIINVVDPTTNQGAATKIYVDVETAKVGSTTVIQNATRNDSGDVTNPENINDGNTDTDVFFTIAGKWIRLHFLSPTWINDIRVWDGGAVDWNGEVKIQIMLGDSSYVDLATLTIGDGEGWESWQSVNRLVNYVRIIVIAAGNEGSYVGEIEIR